MEEQTHNEPCQRKHIQIHIPYITEYNFFHLVLYLTTLHDWEGVCETVVLVGVICEHTTTNTVFLNIRQ